MCRSLELRQPSCEHEATLCYVGLGIGSCSDKISLSQKVGNSELEVQSSFPPCWDLFLMRCLASWLFPLCGSLASQLLSSLHEASRQVRVWRWLTCFLRCRSTIWCLNAYTWNPRFSSTQVYPSWLPDHSCLSTHRFCPQTHTSSLTASFAAKPELHPPKVTSAL